jgi:hypothetical protein
MISEIEFKAKPYFGGDVNEIEANIKDLKTNENFFTVNGHFDRKLFVKNQGNSNNNIRSCKKKKWGKQKSVIRR